MSCSYYIWRSEYYCTKKEERVDEDHYRIYCRDYSYSDCPIYKSDSSSGGCYLTSACTAAMGLPGDCEELSILRRFRDEWLSKQPGGKETIEEYYRIAPGIVRSIESMGESKVLFQRIYDEMVCPCVRAIQEERPKEAWALYERMTRELEKKFK